ncbi:MAG: Flp pilus assembly protein CpaB [Tepidisphaeraceae bacterium]
MKWKAYIPLAVAIVLGLFAARIATSLVNSAPAVVVPQIATTSVAVLARDIEPGVTLSETDLIPAKLASETIPAGALTTSQQLVGKVTKIALVRGQTVTPNLLAEDGAGYGVGATLPEGMRAVTIDINDTTGVAGFVLPKSRVDLIATLQVDGKSIAKTILEGVQVLAVGQRINPVQASADGVPQQNQGQAAPPSRTVTLLVKPKDVEKVELAASMSRIRLVLRNGRDAGQNESEGITVADLRGRRDSDPFADEVRTVATTRPAAVEVTPVEETKPTTLSWTVTTIKAGVPTQQTFEVPVPKTPAKPTTPSIEEDPDFRHITTNDLSNK